MMDFKNDIIKSIDALKNGSIILYPTDTIWGIGCNATNEKAVEKIYTLKKRPDEKSMIILVADEKDISTYVNDPDPAIFSYLQNTTKPTTVIYKNARSLAKNLINKDGTIAIRICKDEFCNELIKRFGKPIVSTSANISGQASPKNYIDVDNEIKEGVDYIVHYRQQENKESAASSIVKWENGELIIIRP